MLRGTLHAILRAIGVIAGVVTLTFVLLHLAPGDPVAHLVGPAATPEQLAAARSTFGLDQPLTAQYLQWLSHAARLDFGNSMTTGRPVVEMIREAWPATAVLVVLSLTLTWVGAIIVGSLQANTRRRSIDDALSLLTVILAAAPGYWLGLVLMLLFTYQLRMLPAFGAAGLDADFLTGLGRLHDRARHVALPLLTLTLIGVGGSARFVRASMLTVRDAPFLVVARARGVPALRVLARHQFRNGLVPLVTLFGLSFPALFSGTVFVEAVFAWPGVGQLLVHGVQARDYPVVMASATIGAVLVVAGNLFAEALLLRVEPRTRVGRRA